MYLTVDIQPVILEFLYRRRFVDLPGLGRLFWTQKKALSGSTYQELLPPDIKINFSDVTEDPSSFLQHLKSTLNISQQRAEEILDSWVENVKGKLKTQGAYDLEQIGEFKMGADGNIQFLPADHKLFTGFNLPTFNLTPIDRPYAPVAGVEHIESPPSNGLFSSVLINIIIPIILLGAIVILLFCLYGQLFGEEKKGDQTAKVEMVDSTGINEEENSVLPVDTALGKESKEDSAISLSGQSEQNTQQVDSMWTEEVIPQGEEENALEKFENRTCIIIVGSFKRQQYADEMYQRIIALELQPYSEVYGDFTRVGVKFDCLKKDLYRTLFQLRGKFGEDAWILKYKD